MVIRTACVVALFLAAPVFGAPPGIERWNRNHPEAAAELGQWVKNHPEAAERFFEWDGRHPERSREFVTWTIVHPGEGIDVVVRRIPDGRYST
jgi:hypothetical protein